MMGLESRLLVMTTLVGLLPALTGCGFLRQVKTDELVMARQASLRGEQALRLGHWTHAERLYHQALQHSSNDHRAHRGYAEALWNRDARDTAIVHMEKAVRFSGEDPKVVVRLGEMYLANGDLTRAEYCAAQAISTDHALPTAWALKGNILFRSGKLDRALASFHRALSLQDRFPSVQLELTRIYRMQQRPRRALATLDVLSRGYESQATPQEVLFLHGLVLKDLGRYDDSVVRLTQAAQRGEPSARLLYELSESQWRAGNPDNARLSLLEALSLTPDHHLSRQLLARIESDRQGLTASMPR